MSHLLTCSREVNQTIFFSAWLGTFGFFFNHKMNNDVTVAFTKISTGGVQYTEQAAAIGRQTDSTQQFAGSR